MFKNLVITFKDGRVVEVADPDEIAMTMNNFLSVTMGTRRMFYSFDEIDNYGFDYDEDEDNESDPRDNIRLLQ